MEDDSDWDYPVSFRHYYRAICGDNENNFINGKRPGQMDWFRLGGFREKDNQGGFARMKAEFGC